MTALVLNADAQPLDVMPLSTKTWSESIMGQYKDKYDIVETYDDWTIHSAYEVIKVPAIVMLREFVQPPRRVNCTKDNLFLRDGYRCQYCGERFVKKELTLDHVIPQYHRGKITWENSTTACKKCNANKAHFLDMRPMTKPRRPSYWDLVNKAKTIPVTIHHPSWADFIGWESNDLVIYKPLSRKQMLEYAMKIAV